MDTFLVGILGEKVDGDAIAYQILEAFKEGNKKVTIRINSVGGSIINGYSVISAMDYIKSNGGIVETINVGAAYSMAGVILACGSKGYRKMYSYAQTMLHAPSYKDNSEEMDESMRKNLENSYKGLINIFAGCTEMPEEEIEKMMDKTTFLTADECKKKKIIDQIIKLQNKMNDLLNLGADADMTAQREAIVNLKAEALAGREAKNELVIAKNRITQLESEIANYKLVENKLKAETIVNKAIEEGKINADSKQFWIESAIVNFDSTTKMLGSLVVTPIVDKLKGGNNSDEDAEKAKKYAELIDQGKYGELAKLPKEFEEAYNKATKVKILNDK